MNAPHVLATDRLLLRKPGSTDADLILARYAADPQVTRYLSWPTHRSIDDTRAFLAFSDERWTQWPAGPYLIEHRASGDLLGSTGFDYESDDRASTGYVLARSAWGYGYATEALRALMRLALQLNLREVYARVHIDHAPSQRVLQKCGFVRNTLNDQLSSFPNHEQAGPHQALCFTWRADILR